MARTRATSTATMIAVISVTMAIVVTFIGMETVVTSIVTIAAMIVVTSIGMAIAATSVAMTVVTMTAVTATASSLRRRSASTVRRSALNT